MARALAWTPSARAGVTFVEAQDVYVVTYRRLGKPLDLPPPHWDLAPWQWIRGWTVVDATGAVFGVKVSDVVVASVCRTSLRPTQKFMVAERIAWPSRGNRCKV